jgi:transcriptional regulator with GAF, ATPase, and Fis domain
LSIFRISTIFRVFLTSHDLSDDTPAECEAIDRIIGQAFEQLGEVIPHDLATLFLLKDDELFPHLTKGPLASEKILAHRLKLQNHPSLRQSILSNTPLVNHEEDHQVYGDPYDGVLDLPHGHSCMVIPLKTQDHTQGVITFDRQVCEPYTDSLVKLAWSYSRMMSLALELAEKGRVLFAAQQRLKDENRWLKSDGGHSNAIELLRNCPSPQMQAVVSTLPKLADSDLPILIGGETGTGKEVLAQAIHDLSRRQRGPFIKLNCSALSANLMESELFGHVKGAFSGAQQNRQGRFAVAHGGTLLLDEIAEIPFEMQAKLLRVLQEGQYEPVGSDQTLKVDVRIVASTHVDLQKAVAQGRFREDLYYRLNVIPVSIPALRARRDDIECIANGVLRSIAHRSGSSVRRLHSLALEQMQTYPWPGNIREMINVLERAQVLSESVIYPEHLNLAQGKASSIKDDVVTGSVAHEQLLSMEAMEKQYIQKVLKHCNGKISGKGGASTLLALKPTTLRSRMEKLGLL